MVERLRVFRGTTELLYSNCDIEQTNDQIVDSGTLSIVGDDSVSVGSIIDIKQNDGVTSLFTAKVQEIKRPNMWELDIRTNGYELMNVWIEQVYTSASPESIVQDIVDNHTTSLTYASTVTSGISLEGSYIAQGYAIDIIKDMMNLLDWQIRIDQTDNFYFEPKGEIDLGRTFTNGDNFSITSWDEDRFNLANKIKVKGGFREVTTTGETLGVTGDPLVFTFAFKPKGNLRVTVSGSEVSTGYTVVSENKTITFDSIPGATPICDYTYDQPIVVIDQDDESINVYGECYQEFSAPFIDNFIDARRYTSNLLEVYSLPFIKAKGYHPYLNFDVVLGETITLIDPVRNKQRKLIVTKIIYSGSDGATYYEFGVRDYVFFDWQREVMQKIKELKRVSSNEETVTFARTFKDKLFANITTYFGQPQWSTPNDSFILGHTTLGRLRTDLNYEADCSNNGNHGTWSGTDILGDQYTLSGKRLSAGLFNGSDNKINTISVISESGIQNISFFMINDINTRDIAKLSSSAKIYTNSSGEIQTTGLTNVSITQETLSGGYEFVSIDFDSLTVDDLILGFETTYFSGTIDEFLLFNSILSAQDKEDIKNNNFYSNHSKYSNCKLWWSMDNPRLGDRESSRQNFN